MAKFKAGQKVKLTQEFMDDYKRLFKKSIKEKFHEFIILRIYEDGIHDPVYFATEPNKRGNCVSFAEQFIEAIN